LTGKGKTDAAVNRRGKDGYKPRLNSIRGKETGGVIALAKKREKKKTTILKEEEAKRA